MRESNIRIRRDTEPQITQREKRPADYADRKPRLSAGEIKRIIAHTLRFEGRPKAKVNLVFVNAADMRRLNLRWFGRAALTDVLAFPAKRASARNFLGDIAISPWAARQAARKFKTLVRDELALYIIHGLLHLLGYDDTSKEAKREMEDRQWQILKKIHRKIQR